MSKLVKMTAIAVALAVAASVGTASAKSSNGIKSGDQKYVLNQITKILENQWKMDKKEQAVISKVDAYCKGHNMDACMKLKRLVKGKLDMLDNTFSKLKADVTASFQGEKATKAKIASKGGNAVVHFRATENRGPNGAIARDVVGNASVNDNGHQQTTTSKGGTYAPSMHSTY